MAVKKIGSVHLLDEFKLRDVLGVPGFKSSLISVRKITRDLNCFLTFFLDKCYVHDLVSKNLIRTGREKDGLYYFEPFRGKEVAMSVWSKHEVWHKILGHASDAVIKKIS